MKIKTLSIQNFKAFGPEQRFDFDNRNVLIYGNNGAGKSSVYYALYTFLQSSIPNKDVAKYFIEGGDECLLNVYTSHVTYPPFIQINTVDNEGLEETFRLDPTPQVHGYWDSNDPIISLSNLASDFMNYRLLFNFYNFRNSEDANLWPVFVQEIMPYWFYDEGQNLTFKDQLSNLFERLYSLYMRRKRTISGKVIQTGRMGGDYQRLIEDIAEFNRRFNSQLIVLMPEVIPLMRDYFLPEDDIEIDIQYVRPLAIRDLKTHYYEWNAPLLRLTATINGYPVPKPQTFLNEARLTALALSIRLAMLGRKFRGTTNEDGPVTDFLKVLVLDDLLISLDMSNRMKVIKYLQTNDDFKNYQLIILTHDKGFFDILRNTFAKGTSDEKWTWFEMFDNGNSAVGRNPVCIEKNDMLSKARFHLEDPEHRDYEVCALYLRRKAEELLRLIYDPSLEQLTRYHQQKTLFKSLEGVKTELEGKAKWQLEKVLNNKSLTDAQVDVAFEGTIEISTLPVEERRAIGDALALKSNLKKMLKWHYQKRDFLKQASDDLIAICTEVNEIRGRILNSGAHFNQEPIYETELRNALDRLEQLKEKTFTYNGQSEF